MKGLSSILLSLLFLISGQSYCRAQVKTDSVRQSTSKTKKSYGLIGINYTSDWVYMGRKDSLQTPYIVPSFEYNHPSGIFLNASLSYLTKEGSSRIDLIALTLGYDYTNWKLSAGASISGYMYDNESYNVQSAMMLYSSTYLNYDFYLIEAMLSVGMGVSDGADGFASMDIIRSFYPFAGTEVRPSARINWGTQRYYHEYYQTNSSSHGSAHRKGKMGSGSSGQASYVAIDEVSKLRLLDYECSLMMLQEIGKSKLFIEGTYAIPLNPAKVTIDESVFEESLKNTLFWSVGMSYTFSAAKPVK